MEPHKINDEVVEWQHQLMIGVRRENGNQGRIKYNIKDNEYGFVM